MAKKYVCRTCKKSYEDRLKLTAHIRFCKSGRLSGKGGKVACPECGKTFKAQGMGAHRKTAHNVAGTSRWALKARKAPSKSAFKPKVAKALQRVMATSDADDVIERLMGKALAHRQEAARLVCEAEKLAKLAADLKEAI